MRQILTVLLSISLVLGPAAPVFAQEPVARSFDDLSLEQKKELARLVDDAKALYNEGDFDGSLRAFQAAYDIYPHPDILYRLGLCYERLNEPSEAIRHYELFLDRVPDAPERPRIEKIIATLTERISKARIRVSSVPEGASVYVNDITNISGTSPTEFPIAPGTHLIIVQKPGYETIEEQVTIKAGETTQLRYQLRREGNPKAEQDVAKTRSESNTTGVVILTSVGIAATISSLVFFSLYSDKRTEVDSLEAVDRQTVSRDRLDDARAAMYTNLGLGIGSAGIATGALVWAYVLWQGDSSATARVAAPSNAPMVTVGGDTTSFGWQWSF